jgi:hypothetical protein
MSGRAVLVPILSALAGAIILAIALQSGQVVSVGSILGVLLLVSGALRFEIARRE